MYLNWGKFNEKANFLAGYCVNRILIDHLHISHNAFGLEANIWTGTSTQCATGHYLNVKEQTKRLILHLLKKSKNHSKRMKFHSRKSEDQSLFTPTQKYIVPNSTLSRVNILLSLRKEWFLLFHSFKSNNHFSIMKITRVTITLFEQKNKFFTLERVELETTRFWVGVKSDWFSHFLEWNFILFGVIFTFLEWNFSLLERFSLFWVNGVSLILFTLLHLESSLSKRKIPVYWPPIKVHYGICANCL